MAALNIMSVEVIVINLYLYLCLNSTVCWVQSLWIAFNGSALSSCPAVDIDTKACTSVSLSHAVTGLPRVLFVRVQPLNGYQRQVSTVTPVWNFSDVLLVLVILII